MVQTSWKSKYIKWYRIVESLFGNDVPHLTETQIEACVSDKDWIIIPVAGEKTSSTHVMPKDPIYTSTYQEEIAYLLE